MRDFAKIAPTFWTGETGRKIRKKGIEARVVAMFLLTGESANAIGIYYLPIGTIAHECGIPFEGASKALQSLSEVEFAYYDHEREQVWVPEAANWQIGPTLNVGDNRNGWVWKLLSAYSKSPFSHEFWLKYREAYRLPPRSPFEGGPPPPSKPGEGEGERTRAEIPLAGDWGRDGRAGCERHPAGAGNETGCASEEEKPALRTASADRVSARVGDGRATRLRCDHGRRVPRIGHCSARRLRAQGHRGGRVPGHRRGRRDPPCARVAQRRGTRLPRRTRVPAELARAGRGEGTTGAATDGGAGDHRRGAGRSTAHGARQRELYRRRTGSLRRDPPPAEGPNERIASRCAGRNGCDAMTQDAEPIPEPLASIIQRASTAAQAAFDAKLAAERAEEEARRAWEASPEGQAALAMERERRRADRIEKLTVRADEAGVPEELWVRQIALDDRPAESAALHAFREAIAWREALSSARGRRSVIRYVAGPSGLGKSCAMAWCVTHHPRRGVFVSASKVAMTPRNAFSTNEAKWEHWLSVDLLCVDEVGLEESGSDQIVFLLVERYNQGLATLAAGNLSRKAFGERYYDERLAGRLRDGQQSDDADPQTFPWYVAVDGESLRIPAVRTELMRQHAKGGGA